VTTASLVSTYAYVNPVIAVFLGWALAGEKLGVRILAATVIIVVSVILVSTPKKVTREEPVSLREEELSETAAD
jgi:drug/metabolite transporter (DMT)-like permease